MCLSQGLQGGPGQESLSRFVPVPRSTGWTQTRELVKVCTCPKGYRVDPDKRTCQGLYLSQGLQGEPGQENLSRFVSVPRATGWTRQENLSGFVSVPRATG